ncbi:hypothetical protein [Streptomyces sp. H51]|uniref:hypothetical protein n=1 Tax=Streptomyces sp. H51 TaxID=3111770 RepID=UPI002D798B9D|nr:hypothetical protein [Streptomyces sp. H51]
MTAPADARRGDRTGRCPACTASQSFTADVADGTSSGTPTTITVPAGALTEVTASTMAWPTLKVTDSTVPAKVFLNGMAVEASASGFLTGRSGFTPCQWPPDREGLPPLKDSPSPLSAVQPTAFTICSRIP